EKTAEEHIVEAIKWMSHLNKTGSELAQEFGVRGGTDITGFGFIGHASEMAEASGLSLQFELTKIPFMSGARSYAEKGIFPGGAFDNKAHFEKSTEFAGLDEPSQMLLFDPQTSGGLLIGLAREKLSAFANRARELNQSYWVVGEARAGSGIRVG
ncbi:MAG: selenide, water dikinase SelD, partial [Chloroflexi bacterium]